MSIWESLLVVASIPVCVACGYLTVLTVFSRRAAPPQGSAPRLRFDVIVPAHDEEGGIAGTVRSLLSLDYPRELFRVLVVADNCGDRTAARAAEAGAEVLVRQDQERRGKGYALAYAFERSLQGTADAVVVIDADTVVSANLLSAFAARIGSGARAVQADYGVRNPQASWRTRLMTLALAMFHILRSLGRERLRLSCGLRGNGMCFTRAVLQAVPHQAYSIVEDLEYGIRLGEAGYRVHYAEEAHVYGEMVSAERASRSQRRRWEGGRLRIARKHGPGLLARALGRRDRILLDLAFDVLVPPLSLIAAATVAGLCASAVLAARGGGTAPLWPWGACTLALAAYVLRGWRLSGTGGRGLLDLLRVPGYLLWKLTLLFRRDPARNEEWIRTQREGRSKG
jgi:1,2-diacylglycerol 3-beta-glucosyltransferase